jgi:tetratricopeptide (TPR) repeat protein
MQSHSPEECHQLERQAHQFLMEDKTEKAYETYQSAARCYQTTGKHEQAALCFTQAASCWNKSIGQHPLRKAAEAYEEAAGESLLCGDFKHAKARFADAALLYEKEGTAEKYSACFYRSKCAEARMEWNYFLRGSDALLGVKGGWRSRWISFFRCLANLHNRMIWGYGEKPFRTLLAALLVILGCAVLYAEWGSVVVHGSVRDIHFFEGIYFSVVTYTTVGYGDYMPADFLTRVVAGGEAISGILLTPIFLIGLTRRYLRMSH